MLNVSQSTSGEWILSASPELDAATLEEALRGAADMEIFHVPADADEIDDAIAKLKSVTSRPVWMDNTDAINWEETIAEAMANYPIDVVRAACVAWREVPKHGEWWPTEPGLRRQCEAIYKPRRSLFNKARMLLQDLRNAEAAASRQTAPSAFAGDKARRFQAEMRKRLGEDRYLSYFDAAQISYGDDVVYVRTAIADSVFDREGRDVLRALGLRVVYAPEQFGEIRTSHPTETPTQSAATAAKLKRLLEAMSNGEDLHALRKRGEI